MVNRRRQSDPRIDTLVADVATLKVQMRENTEVTVQVRDILSSFRIIARIAKWFTVMAAAIAGTYAALKAGWDFHHTKL